MALRNSVHSGSGSPAIRKPTRGIGWLGVGRTAVERG